MGPTEQAKQHFSTAAGVAQLAINRNMSNQQSHDFLIELRELAEGLGHMATGLRATYIALERVEKKLDELAKRIC